MANDNPIGDAVRFDDDERLDIPDAKRLQRFVYEALADALGGIMGECAGVLTQPAFGSNVGAVTIGECMLAGFRRKAGSTRRVRGGVFHYDPASPYQAGSTTVNLSAYQSPERFPYLWFCRREMEADQESRRRHVGGVEASYTPNTTKRQRIGFGVTIDREVPPNETDDWFVFARVIAWSGSFPNKVPTIQPIHAFDKGLPLGTNANVANQLGMLLMYTGDADTSLARAIGLLANFVLRLTSNTHGFDAGSLEVSNGSIASFYQPSEVRGVKELHAATLVLEGIPRPLYIGRLVYNAGLTAYELEVVFDSGLVTVGLVSNTSWGNAGLVARMVVTPAAGVTVHAVDADILSISGGGGGHSYPLTGSNDWMVPARANSTNLPTTGAFNFEVGAWNPTQAVAADRPTVAKKIGFAIFGTKV
jgi:hypothetical protein